MQSKNKEILVMGFALFAMFFGAGNVIFPPYIGIMGGSDWPAALLGFTITGMGMPLTYPIEKQTKYQVVLLYIQILHI